MKCDLAINFDLIYVFLKCSILIDTIEVDLKVSSIIGIYTYKRGYRSQESSAAHEEWKSGPIMV